MDALAAVIRIAFMHRMEFRVSYSGGGLAYASAPACCSKEVAVFELQFEYGTNLPGIYYTRVY